MMTVKVYVVLEMEDLVGLCKVHSVFSSHKNAQEFIANKDMSEEFADYLTILEKELL